jgi:hypothetical protein
MCLVKNMKNLKKNIILLGAFAIALLVMSTATALPQVQSKPVMDQIQQKEAIKNQLMTIYNQLKNQGDLAVGSQQNPHMNPSDDLDKLFDEEGFLNHLTSDTFIQFLNNNYNSIASDSLFQDFYNSESIQEFTQSDEFVAFMNSDEIQYVLDHFNPGSNNQIIETLERTTTTFGGNSVIAGSTTPSFGAQLYAWEPGMIIFIVFYFLFIGIITWIPTLIVAIIAFPIYWDSLYAQLLAICPTPLIALIVSFLAVLVYEIIAVGLWPLIWWIIIFSYPPD